MSFPSTPVGRAAGLRLSDPTVTSRAQNGRRIARKASGHVWSFTIEYPPMTRAVFAPVLGAIAAARGSFGTFTYVLPHMDAPLGTQTASTSVAANRAAGTTSISLSGAGAGATFKAGDLVKFSNHTKAYMITGDAAATSMGAATILIQPPLISSITTSHTAQHSNVPFTVALVSDVQEFSTDVNNHYRYELDVEEVF